MHSRKSKWVVRLGLLFGLLFVRLFESARNYEDPNGPMYAGTFSDRPSQSGSTVTVVSYNIKYAQNIDVAIQEFGELKPLVTADIILLQEVDEIATAQLSKTHGYNYVYFLAAIHPRHKKNFGNAILSKWPIAEVQK